MLKDIVGETRMIYRRICKDSRGFEQIHKARLYISYESCMYIDMQRYAMICKYMQRDTGLYNNIQGHTRRHARIYKDAQGTMYMHIFTQRYARIYIDQNWWAPLFEAMSVLQHVAALQGTP